MKTLKQKLDAAWNINDCAYPCHKAKWSINCLGWLRVVKGTFLGKRKYFHKNLK
jgi:hypothetical protein